MASASELTTNELLDIDVAILVFGAPIWIAGFLLLIVAGAWNDWRGGRG